MLDDGILDWAMKSFGVEGTWYYTDLPKMSRENFNKLLDLFGMDNVRFITMAEYPGNLVRGQLIYSEQGRLNLKEYSDAK